MPYEIKKSDRCPAERPIGVFNSETGKLHGCHTSEDKARAQQKALYANTQESKVNEIREKSNVSFREGVNGKREAVLIEAGWGSSGYYSEDVLARDIPKIFPPGTHMYLDHPTVKEEKERPERSVRDLVGTISSPPRMSGIASVAEVDIFPHWKPVIEALEGDIGLSIRAMGTAESGSAGGKEGPIIHSLDEGISIDYVTKPGAGGRLLPMIESARAKDDAEKLEPATEATELVTLSVSLAESVANESWEAGKESAQSFVTRIANTTKKSDRSGGESNGNNQEEQMPELKEELSESQSQVRRLTEEKEKLEKEKKEADQRADRAEDALLLREASSVVAKEVGSVKGLPAKAQGRISDSVLSADLPLNSDGKLNESELRERTKKAVQDEVDYLKGVTSGRVTGLGESQSGNGSDSDSTKALQMAFEKQGMSESAAKSAAEGR